MVPWSLATWDNSNGSLVDRVHTPRADLTAKHKGRYVERVGLEAFVDHPETDPSVARGGGVKWPRAGAWGPDCYSRLWRAGAHPGPHPRLA